MSLEGKAITEYASLSGKIHTLVIDKTLSISGAAADAKATGEAVDKLEAISEEAKENYEEAKAAYGEAVASMSEVAGEVAKEEAKKIKPSDIGAATNPNLLDNWYFADPIDQRCGYVLPTGTTFYTNSALTTVHSNSPLEKYYAVAELTPTYALFKGNSGGSLYAAASDAVRGYIGTTYAIDRWRVNSAGNNHVFRIENGFSSITAGEASVAALRQQFDSLPAGTYTISVLMDSGLESVTLEWDGSTRVEQKVSFGTLCLQMFGSGGGDTNSPTLSIFTDALVTMNILAVKVECGSVQTLARQENGSWVLNDAPPNKAMEQIKCVQSKADSTDAYANAPLAAYETGSYVGTGDSANGMNDEGEPDIPANVSSLTFNHAPTVLFITGGSAGMLLNCIALPTDRYITEGPLDTASNYAVYAKKSEDGKTIYWLSVTANVQMNNSNTTYNYVAFC